MQEISGTENISPDRLSSDPTVHPTARISESRLGEWTDIRRNTRIHASEIGAYTYLMDRVQVDYATIGKFCSIASDVHIGPTNHPISRPTSHHMTYRVEKYGLGCDDESVFEWRADNPVTIGHDVWIGTGAIVTPGVTIGTGAVIGAGAVVTSDVDPFVIVAGVPAEPIRRRFSVEVAEQLGAIAWWDWSREKLASRIDDFQGDISQFIEKYGSDADAVQ